MFKRVLITGGAGYVGAVLVPRLLAAGYVLTVLDLFLYGDHVLDPVRDNPGLTIVKGDMRDRSLVAEALQNCDAVIHLACISNDPSFELNPDLGRSINYDAFRPLVQACRDAGVRRFIYASTSSVYGISVAENVTEEHPLKPLTDYSRFKALCEDILLEHQAADFVPVIVRPATVCGYSPRQRLDVIVNILTNHAVNRGRITVTGGIQKRPNIHIDDMARIYHRLLEFEDPKIAGKIYNIGSVNHTVSEIARIVRTEVMLRIPGHDVSIAVEPTDDLRSYHICSDKIGKELGLST